MEQPKNMMSPKGKKTTCGVSEHRTEWFMQ